MLSKLTIFVLVLVLVAIAMGEPTEKTVVVRPDLFCLLMPPRSGGGIAENEHRSISFCTSGIRSIPYSKPFPDGFIKSVHYHARADRYVQVTGRIDRRRYNLSRNDEGGQNDPKAPRGASCRGYDYFVQFIEPNEGIYCLRCCMNRRDCPTNRSEDGCRAVIGGDYS
jgi:hypothetical protein